MTRTITMAAVAAMAFTSVAADAQTRKRANAGRDAQERAATRELNQRQMASMQAGGAAQAGGAMQMGGAASSTGESATPPSGTMQPGAMQPGMDAGAGATSGSTMSGSTGGTTGSMTGPAMGSTTTAPASGMDAQPMAPGATTANPGMTPPSTDTATTPGATTTPPQ